MILYKFNIVVLTTREDGISSIAQLVRTCEILYYSQRIYSFAVTDYMIVALRSGVDIDQTYDPSNTTTLSRPAKFAKKFSKSLHSIFIDTLPSDLVYNSLILLTFKSCSSIFRIKNDQSSKSSSKYEITHEASLQLMQLFENLKDVGLGGVVVHAGEMTARSRARTVADSIPGLTAEVRAYHLPGVTAIGGLEKDITRIIQRMRIGGRE